MKQIFNIEFEFYFVGFCLIYVFSKAHEYYECIYNLCDYLDFKF